MTTMPPPKYIHDFKKVLKATFLSICQGAIDILREEEEVFYVKVCNPSFPFGGFSIPPPASLSGKFSHDRFLLLQGVAHKNATI